MSRDRPVYRQRSTWVVAVALLLWIGFEVLPLLEPPGITYRNLPFPVLGPVQIGHEIPILVSRCSTLTKPTDVEFVRSLVPVGDERLAMGLGSGRTVVMPGCTESLSYTTTVPPNTTPGTYMIVGIISVDGRLGATKKVQYLTAPFEVIP